MSREFKCFKNVLITYQAAWEKSIYFATWLNWILRAKLTQIVIRYYKSKLKLKF